MSDDSRLAERRAQIAAWRAAGFIVPWDPADYPEPDPRLGPFGVNRAEWDFAGGWRGFFSRLALVILGLGALVLFAVSGMIR